MVTHQNQAPGSQFTLPCILLLSQTFAMDTEQLCPFQTEPSLATPTNSITGEGRIEEKKKPGLDHAGPPAKQSAGRRKWKRRQEKPQDGTPTGTALGGQRVIVALAALAFAAEDEGCGKEEEG